MHQNLGKSDSKKKKKTKPGRANRCKGNELFDKIVNTHDSIPESRTFLSIISPSTQKFIWLESDITSNLVEKSTVDLTYCSPTLPSSPGSHSPIFAPPPSARERTKASEDSIRAIMSTIEANPPFPYQEIGQPGMMYGSHF